jgi:DnaK suppressor protein
VKTPNKTKPPGQSAVASKTSTTAAKAKPAAAKSVAKPAAKAVAKPATKVAAKPAAKAAAKPAAKAAAKPSAKAPVKPVAKVAAKAVTKPVAKPAAKPAVKAKPTPKPAVPAKAVKDKSAAVSAAASKAAAQSSPTRSSAAPKVATAAPPAQTPKTKNMSVTKVESVQAPVESNPVSAAPASEQLVRATRPSARLAQITVPSLPPAVASTAAKSSFLPSAAPAPVAVPFAPIKKDPKLANNWKTKKVEELSDAEILAMSDDEYMNDKQMAYFRLKLNLLKQDILASAGQTTEHLREDTVVVPDPADRATIEEEHALELRTRDRERKLLKKIEQSIQRIDAGDYGFCDETGEAIGVGRLLARPTATLSLEAQQRRELKQKMFGD